MQHPNGPLYAYEGYATGYDFMSVRGYAADVAAAVRRIKAQRRARGLHSAVSIVVTGNSGVSCAFSALMLEDFDLFLLRKDSDNSHGAPLEGPAGAPLEGYYILDDFVDTGATVSRVLGRIQHIAEAKGHVPPYCEGVLLYKRSYERALRPFEHDDQVIPCIGVKGSRHA